MGGHGILILFMKGTADVSYSADLWDRAPGQKGGKHAAL